MGLVVTELGERQSGVLGLEVTDLGERSTDSREFWRGEGESDSDLAAPPLLNLVTLGLGVAGEALLLGVSDKVVDLSKIQNLP